MSARRVAICGAFNASVTLRPHETPEQAAERVERTLQAVLDTYTKRLDVRIGVDYGAIDEVKK